MATLPQCLLAARRRPRDSAATRYSQGDLWLTQNWQEVYRATEVLSGALASLGIGKGDRVAILSDTRREWWLSDLAILGLGAVTVPIYPSQRPEDIAFILNDSNAKVLILENFSLYQKWQSLQTQCPSVTHAILIDTPSEPPNKAITWDDFLNLGQKFILDRPLFFEEAVARQTPSDEATIVYTSGTTGEPKGVRLSHRQIMSEVQSVLSVIPITQSDVSLSFLPYAHVLGRLEGWAAVVAGFCLGFAQNIDRLRANLLTVKPTILIAVPRVFEKLHAAIRSQAESNPARQKIFSAALKVGREVSTRRRNREALPPHLMIQALAAEKLVFSPLRKKLGGRLRFAVSGGAPLAKDIAEFFHAIGILILEGYGLTETTAAIAANSPLAYKFGTVGKPLPGAEIRLADDGEILVRGPTVMLEYSNQPEATKEAMPNGFFHTGDIGEFDADGFLRITDRKKDLIKTAGGKYIAPQKLENLLKMNPFISQVLIHGDQEKYVVAVLTLNPDLITTYARERQISFQDYASLTQHPQIKGLIRSLVAEVNSKLAGYETIKNFAVLSHDFTIDAGEMTPSLKVRRKFCSEKYRDLIASLYD